MKQQSEDEPMKINVEAIKHQAKEELQEEATKQAKEKLKGLYLKKEKAALVLKNIDREIESYLSQVEELTTYAAAGVTTEEE